MEELTLEDRDFIGSDTSIKAVVETLKKHGCPDLTSQIDWEACQTVPQATGAYSDVFQGKLNNGNIIAIKSMRFYMDDMDGRGKSSLKRAAKEIHGWYKMRHPNIVPLMGFAIFRGRLSMVSPWMVKGTVMQYLWSNPRADRFQLCLNTCEGLCYLHNHNMVHGDVKGANVLVNNDGTPVITDFGSTQLGDASLAFSENSKAGVTLRWAAPELIMEDGARQTKASDVYGYGMTVLEILTGEPPFNDLKSTPAVFMAITKKEHPKRPDINLDEDSWMMLTSCWSHPPSNRPSMEDVRSNLQEMRDKRERLSTQPSPDPWNLHFDTTRPHTGVGSAEPQHGVQDSPQVGVQTGVEGRLPIAAESPTGERPEERPETRPEEQPVSQPEARPDESDQEAGKPVISTKTPVEEMINILTQHGCLNLTSDIVLDDSVTVPFTGGGFADVYQGTMSDGTVIAIKQLKQLDPTIILPKDISEKMHKRTARELHHWSQLDHENVIPLLGLATFQGRLSMISQWMSGGDLRRYLAIHPNADRIKLCVEVGAGLCHLHSCGMVHGDLKGKNVMVSKEGVAMIGDFGTALMADLPIYFTQTLQQAPNSYRWAAPEVLLERDPKATKESDIYSYGMETLTGESPYADEIQWRVMGMKASGELPPRPDIGIIDDMLWQTLLLCWDQVPKQRIMINALMLRMRHVARVTTKLPVYQNPQPEDLDYINAPPDATMSYYEYYHHTTRNPGLSAVESTNHSDLSRRQNTEYYTALTSLEEDRQ